jgi:hypothetical protein
MLGYKRVDAKEFSAGIKVLEKVKAIEIQRSGYQAHSLYHQKIVVIRDWNAVKNYFKIISNEEFMKVIPEKKLKKPPPPIIVYAYTCKLPEEEKCSWRRWLQRQGIVCTFPNLCNQKCPRHWMADGIVGNQSKRSVAGVVYPSDVWGK